MSSQRLRVAIGAGIGVAVLIALSSLATGTLPVALALGGAIPAAIVTGLVVYLLLPLFGARR
jgi:hypothetical protein